MARGRHNPFMDEGDEGDEGDGWDMGGELCEHLGHEGATNLRGTPRGFPSMSDMSPPNRSTQCFSVTRMFESESFLNAASTLTSPAGPTSNSLSDPYLVK